MVYVCCSCRFCNLTGRVWHTVQDVLQSTSCIILHLTFSLEHNYHASGKPILVSIVSIHDAWDMLHALCCKMGLRITQLSADNKGDH
jgi:hypothetical protein